MGYFSQRKVPWIDSTEEFVMNQDFLGDEFRGWRRYRLEYGGFNEYCQFEGTVYLPPHADVEAVVQLMIGMAFQEGSYVKLAEDDK